MKLELWNRYTHIKGVSLVVTNNHRLNIYKREQRPWTCTLYLDGWFASIQLGRPVFETGRLPF